MGCRHLDGLEAFTDGKFLELDGKDCPSYSNNMPDSKIKSPDDPLLGELCALLAERAIEMDRSGAWPAEQLRLCAEYGVCEWFIGREWGGQGWSDEDVVRGYLALSAACLTTTFVFTQRTGACRRIEGCGNEQLKARLLPRLASGELFATVGI